MADTAQALIEEFVAAYLTGDVDAIADCYEDDAILVIADLQIVAYGKQAIREAWAGLVAMTQTLDFTIDSREEGVDGDLAYAHMSATSRVKLVETGEEDTMSVRSTEVMHRGVDGQWRYVVDHA